MSAVSWAICVFKVRHAVFHITFAMLHGSPLSRRKRARLRLCLPARLKVLCRWSDVIVLVTKSSMSVSISIQSSHPHKAI